MKKAVILTISGRVQNVGFRYHTHESAKKHAISGFVKNEYNGTVYVEAEGEEENLDQFILWCQTGPRWARVDKVNTQEMPLQNFEGFTVK